ncbi:MAG: tRNA pseudouridine(13) synthase TruD [Gammaproteobacteria bacterium]|nr:tRNA pseudouridine(13) synthase TruD [Gammaproteobacteria bacterium]MCW8987481.1 tRNA pseudouridine(13) synthase TruD [Gammaproteobacteria bacterium]MCW9030174.1 tRNA pseudouridine(13) synthase TruD [Gammaproteobacteria bacterium]
MFDFSSYHYANGEPSLSGVIRTQASDFKVDEKFAFEATGEGEHALLHVKKQDTNTEWLSRQISQLAGVRKVDVSYAGLKDRNAVTTQWFSVWLPGKPDPDWSLLNSDNVEILATVRHNRKLRRGSLRGNQFALIVRNVEGDISDLEQRMNTIRHDGVPNYFGDQRFGIDGKNLEKAEIMFAGKREKDRFRRSIYLSAARSAMFNDLLSERVAMNKWANGIAGDVMLLDNSHSYFLAEEIDEKINQRLKEHDIHPSGPLWGRGELLSKGVVAELEYKLKDKFPVFDVGLKNARLDQERRSLRLSVNDFKWKYNEDHKLLELNFFLSAGGYATSVLREIIKTR